MIDFSSQMKNLLMNILKLLEILGFSRFFFLIFKFQIFKFFLCLNCQIPGYSWFPGKVATLFIILLNLSNLLLVKHSKQISQNFYFNILRSSFLNF